MEIEPPNAQVDLNTLGDHTAALRKLFRQLGDDPDREGLRDTPMRYLKFLREFISPQGFNFTTFDSEGMTDLIVQTEIPFYSLCEHHLAPFFGVAAVGYIPRGRIVGLSKLARTVGHFAGRLQNQERITQQVADLLVEKLNPEAVAVVLKARHLCVEMRGVKAAGTVTTTSRMTGTFIDNAPARAEFLSLIK